MIELERGLRYPWQNGKRLLNILWVLIPILGFLAVVNYIKKIVQTIVGGDTSELPEFGGFWENVKSGFMLIIKAIPLIVVTWVAIFILAIIPIIGWIGILVVELFVLPWLIINYLVKETVASSFEFAGVSAVFNNLGEYVMVLLKTIVYVIAYGILSIVIVGIPCIYFGQYLFLADFYTNYRA